MKVFLYVLTIAMFNVCTADAQSGANQVRTMNGIVEGVTEPSGIRSFKGVPYAAPPVGEWRFREPQPVRSWEGIRPAKAFGPRAMQLPIYSDMQFRSNGVSEDCLYLNVWTPAKPGSVSHLPVLVYFYGGGFAAGDGSEYRYDGESLARRGIVTVTVNYRLGVFGFLAHPDLTKESVHHCSGNYALLDQHAALVWVQQNIAAFGGDPAHVTIGGESAGSFSVSAQVATPLNKGLVAGAIGESGSLLGNRAVPLAVAEKNGLDFAAGLGNKSLADLRAMSAEELLAATSRAHFPTTVDGYFFPSSPDEIYAKGAQLSIPLLAGWNSAEQNYSSLLGKEEPTVENYEKGVGKWYSGDKAAEVLKLYPAATPAEVMQAGTDLASDRFIAYGTWKWIDRHSKTSGKPVYRYLYAHPRPPVVGAAADAVRPVGAGHSWEIEYALGNLSTNKVYAWTADDAAVSETLESYFANFIKTGDPNGKGLPRWPVVKGEAPSFMVIDVKSHVGTEQHAARYRWWDRQN
jgi:para-nitrobenzyl esterase